MQSENIKEELPADTGWRIADANHPHVKAIAEFLAKPKKEQFKQLIDDDCDISGFIELNK